MYENNIIILLKINIIILNKLRNNICIIRVKGRYHIPLNTTLYKPLTHKTNSTHTLQ